MRVGTTKRVASLNAALFVVLAGCYNPKEDIAALKTELKELKAESALHSQTMMPIVSGLFERQKKTVPVFDVFSLTQRKRIAQFESYSGFSVGDILFVGDDVYEVMSVKHFPAEEGVQDQNELLVSWKAKAQDNLKD